MSYVETGGKTFGNLIITVSFAQKCPMIYGENLELIPQEYY